MLLSLVICLWILNNLRRNLAGDIQGVKLQWLGLKLIAKGQENHRKASMQFQPLQLLLIVCHLHPPHKKSRDKCYNFEHQDLIKSTGPNYENTFSLTICLKFESKFLSAQWLGKFFFLVGNCNILKIKMVYKIKKNSKAKQD